MLKDVRSSVVRLSVAQCAGDPTMGSGFMLADDLVMTAAHVVKGSRTVSVQTESDELASATVIAYEEGQTPR